MSKKKSWHETPEGKSFKEKWETNTAKVKAAGITIGKTSGMGNENYYFSDAISGAYPSHHSIVEDIVKEKKL